MSTLSTHPAVVAIARLGRRVRAFLLRRTLERDLDDELRFHMEMAHTRHLAHGHSPADARTLTHKEFGPMDLHKEHMRDAHGLTVADDLRRDVRLGLRTLLRAPGFTIVALITFALGIGANTAIFSVVNAVLLRPLPYPNAARLVDVHEAIRDHPDPGPVSYQNFLDWQRQTTTMHSLGAYVTSRTMLDNDAGPERVREGLVTTEVLPLLGQKPSLGRWFVAEEGERGKQRVVILSDQLWRRRFGADRAIVGKAISLEGTPYTVVGVMPPQFNFPAGPRVVDLWAPLVPPLQAVDPRARGWHWMSVIGLLEPGVSAAHADVEMRAIALRLQQAYPLAQANRSAGVTDLRQSLVGDVRRMLYVLLGAVSLVLLIACANVANLMLARHATRRKDVLVRVALGASRAQLVRQFLVESVLLALLGAALGLGVSRLVLHVLTSLGPEVLPTGASVPLDARVFAALIAAAVACGIAFGLAPALQLSSNDVRGGLAGLSVKTTGGGEMRRFRSGLVVTQVALSLMLLVGAGLLMRGFVALRSTDSGIVADHVLTAHVNVARRYLRAGVETGALLRPLLEHVRSLPGVRSAAVVTNLPFDASSGASASFWIDRKPRPAPGNEPLIMVRAASPGYFATLGIPLKTGRDFTEGDDTTGVRKAIVNEALVRRLLAGENAIGRHLLQGNAQQPDEYEIIGVVSDVRQSSLDQPPEPEVYTPYADARVDWAVGDVSLVVKSATPALSIVPQVRHAVRDVARDVALTQIQPMSDVIEGSLANRKLTLTLFGIFAGVALLLAASGLYGVIYYLVAQRTREIGIRVALGARTSLVVAMVLAQGGVLVGTGILLGVIGALALSRLLDSLLFGVGARDPLTFVSVPIVLAVVALLATIVPAWKAAHVDPVIALREE